MKHERTVPREQLYRELWAEPALVVAKRCGISDVGLAKACRTIGDIRGLPTLTERPFSDPPAGHSPGHSRSRARSRACCAKQ
jgi:hypothetical protein